MFGIGLLFALLMHTAPFPHSLTEVLINQAPEFLGIYDVKRQSYTRINTAGVQLLGCKSAECFLSRPAPQLRTPHFSVADWTALRTAARQHGRQDTSTDVECLDGSTFSAGIELTCFEEQDTAFFLVRISRQPRLPEDESKLAQSVRRYKAVFANATIGIIVCSRAGTIVSANQMACRQLGYAAETLCGQRIEAVGPGATSHYERLCDNFRTRPHMDAMSAHRHETEARHCDGTVFPVEVSLSCVFLDDELYIVSYVLDITSKKDSDQALVAQRLRVERRNAELEQKVAARTSALTSTLGELGKALAAEKKLGELKSLFVALASHEFRSPLTVVLSSASLLEQYPAFEQQPQRQVHVERIRQSVRHLNNILEEFLSVARIEEGRVLAYPERISVAALLANIVADVQGLLKTGQTIVREISCPETVWLDPSLLRKIIVNLLSNALKYSGENCVVTLRVDCSGNLLRVMVIDQGIGISAADQTHLFERFFRARDVAYVPGTGLGLYIIAKYSEMMGGTIDLQSTLAVGTTVTLRIPYEEYPTH